MNLELLTDGVAGDKPWLNIVCNDISSATTNHVKTFTSSAFNGICFGQTPPYTLGTPISGSSGQTTLNSFPNSDWTLGDCKLTYNGLSGSVFFYGVGCGFTSDTTGTYTFGALVNGIAIPFNTQVTYVPVINTLITGAIQGLVRLNTGDYLQIEFDKGSDIVGAPVVDIGGMGFDIYKVGN